MIVKNEIVPREKSSMHSVSEINSRMGCVVLSGLVFGAMVGRILLLGYERVAVKQAGEQNDPLASTFLLFGIAGILMLPLLLIDRFTVSAWLMAAVSSLFYSMAFVLYVKSLSSSDVSLVSPFYNLNVLFLLFLSVVFLSESFTVIKLSGIVFLVLGATLIERRQNLVESFKAVLSNKGCQLMTGASFLIAVGRVIDARVTTNVSPLVYASGVYFMISFSLCLIILSRKKMNTTPQALSGDKKYFLAAAGANAYSYVFLLVAIQEIEVSIAEPLSMLSVFVTLILSHVFLKENAKARFIGTSLMVLGSMFLVISM